jgi:peroxiredoxin Q/BCP
MPFPEAGTPAPPLHLPDPSGQPIDVADLKGKWVVVYFYPKDDTPGCTKEACNFRDNYGALKAAGATVLGVSADSAASHTKFAQKYELPFTLLSDTPDHAAARAYGAWGLKMNYGKQYESIIRSTFVIDPEGRVAKVWPRVRPDQHGEEVLEWLKKNASN